MNVWLIHIGELLPVDGPVRPFRYGILAEMLARRGHRVTRWAPTFVHATKCQRHNSDATVTINDRYRIELLYAGAYRRHVGWERLLFNHRFAKAFERRVGCLAPPDLIIAALPTPETCDAAVRYAQSIGVPVFVDVRDLWPDIFVDVMPPGLQLAARLALTPLFRKTRRALSNATGVLAVSHSYLRWALASIGRAAGPRDHVFHLGYRKPLLRVDQRQNARDFWRAQGVLEQRSLRCCYFGAMNTTCDIETVLEAARHIQASHSGVEFVICGDGPRLGEFKRMAHDLPNVQFAGWVDHAQIVLLMEWSDIGLAAYGRGAPQSVPNKSIEYLAGGLPVVSSLKGELEAFLNNGACGIPYNPGEASKLAAQLVALAHDSKRVQAMKRGARHLFRTHFRAEQVYSQMVSFLEGGQRLRQTRTEASGSLPVRHRGVA